MEKSSCSRTLAAMWREEVECPLHSSEQIAARAEGKITPTGGSFKSEATRQQVCLSVWRFELDGTRTSSVASFILEIIRVEKKKYVGGNRRNQIQNR